MYDDVCGYMLVRSYNGLYEIKVMLHLVIYDHYNTE